MIHEILKDFLGSQDGSRTEKFTAGTHVEVSDYLVSCIPADWVRQTREEKTVEIENKAVVSDGMKRKK